MMIPRYFLVPSPCSVVLSHPGILFKACMLHRRKASWRGSLEGKDLAGVGGVGPHELLFGLFQEQMWYLGLAV